MNWVLPSVTLVAGAVVGGYVTHFFTMRQYRVQKSDASQFEIATKIDDLIAPYLPYLMDIGYWRDDEPPYLSLSNEEAEELAGAIGVFLPRLADEALRERISRWLGGVRTLRLQVWHQVPDLDVEQKMQWVADLFNEYSDIRVALGKYHH